MPHDLPGRGQRAKTNKETRRDAVTAATKKSGYCPTCGQKVSGSTVGASVGGGSG